MIEDTSTVFASLGGLGTFLAVLWTCYSAWAAKREAKSLRSEVRDVRVQTNGRFTQIMEHNQMLVARLVEHRIDVPPLPTER